MLQFISPTCVLFRPKPIPQYLSHPELVQGVWGTLICSTEHGVSLRPRLSLLGGLKNAETMGLAAVWLDCVVSLLHSWIQLYSLANLRDHVEMMIPMPTQNCLSLDAIRELLNMECPHCHNKITPAERQTLDTEEIRCPKCRKAFVPGVR
jgi:hypothetical protein